MAQDKKKARRLGAQIVFVDESGFLLMPNVCKTWAPRGQTPILRHMYRRDRISAISAISVSPARRRVGLYYQLYSRNIRSKEVCRFLRHLLRKLRGPIIVLWDGASIHKGGPIRQLCSSFRRIHLEVFPPYAPELNPDEGVWQQAKRKLANGRPEDVNELRRNLVRTFRKLRRSRANLCACISQSELSLFLP